MNQIMGQNIAMFADVIASLKGVIIPLALIAFFSRFIR